MRFPKITAARSARLGVAAVVVAAGTLGLAASNSYGAAVSFTLGSATGPSTAASVLSVTGSGFKNATGAITVNTGAGGIQFQTTAACAQTMTSGINITYAAGNIVSATKLVFTIPSGLLALGTASAPKAYMLCVYSSASTPALIGSAKYTVYATPTVTALSPTAGRSYGGTSVAISGTAFTAKTTATIGGAAVKDIKVAADGLSLTGTVPAGTAGAQNVIVSTEGGSVTGATQYTYTSAISITPTTGLNTGGTVLDITGVGFTATFNLTTNPNVAVVFTSGPYLGSSSILGTCTSPQVVSDTELVCSTPAVADSAYSVVVVADNTAAPGVSNPVTAVTSGSTFTVAAF